jgi:hypothetical protein
MVSRKWVFTKAAIVIVFMVSRKWVFSSHRYHTHDFEKEYGEFMQPSLSQGVSEMK